MKNFKICKGDMSILPVKLPDKKKPRLGIQVGNEVMIYGCFKDEARASMFMRDLARFINIEIPKEFYEGESI